MPDDNITLADLRARVRAFVDERDWEQFHTPKNLAVSIAIEAAELLEHFQWTDEPAPNQLPQLLEELADVMIYCLTLANALDIDLSQAVIDKLALNARKYPVEVCRGRL